MRIGLAVAACATLVGGAASAEETDGDASAQQRLALVLPPLTATADAAPAEFLTPGLTADSNNVGRYLSGGLAFHMEYAISDQWGLTGAIDWQRHHADGPDANASEIGRPVDSILASGQISFEF